MIKEFFRDVKKGQRTFGEDMQYIINFIMLTFVYFVGVGITSIFAKIFNKQFLDMEFSKQEKTYWKDYGKKGKIEDYYKQF